MRLCSLSGKKGKHTKPMLQTLNNMLHEAFAPRGTAIRLRQSGRMIGLLACLIVAGMAGSAGAAVDTLHVKCNFNIYINGQFEGMNDFGWVENNIIYASNGGSAGYDVKIVGINFLDSTAKVTRIPRTGKNGSESFRFIKQGNTAFFNDSNILRIYDIANPASPVSKYAVDVGTMKIMTVLSRNDTLLVGQDGGEDQYITGFSIIRYNSNPPAVLNAFKYLGGGYHAFLYQNRYFRFSGLSIAYWNFPLSERIPDGGLSLPSPKRDYMAVKDKYAFLTSKSGTDVYDLTNFNRIITLINSGLHIELYENLLILGGDSLRIYDISNINSIQMVAVFPFYRTIFKVDKVTNYLYLLIERGSSYVDVIDLSKYVKISNHAPVLAAAADSIKVSDTQAATWTARATDADGDAVTFSFGALPGYITKTSDSTLSIAPGNSDNNATVRVIANDGKGGLDTFDLRVIVDHVVGVSDPLEMSSLLQGMRVVAGKNGIRVWCNANKKGSGALSIYNVNGSLAYRSILGAHMKAVVISGLCPGIYYVHYVNGAHVITQPVLVSR